MSEARADAETLEFIKPFIGAVQVALTKQANVELKHGKPFFKKGKHAMDFGIAGVVNLVSAQFNGSISLLFPTPVFLFVYNSMLGEKLDKITAESEDAAAELLNIIFGLAKMKLNNEKGYTLQKAIPTVLVGDKIQTSMPTVGFTVVLPFQTKAGDFLVEVVFDQSQDAKK